MSNVIELTDANFEREVLHSELPVLVDYWAPWFGPCRVVGPVIERIADERTESLKVAKVNVDEEPRLADAAGVRGIPFLVLYRDGKPVSEVVGAHPKHTLEAALSLEAPVSSTDQRLINRANNVVPFRRGSGPGRSIRVLVAAGRALLQAAYRAMLENEDRIAVVGEVASAGDAITLATQTRPDILLLDLVLPGLDDVEATARTVSHPAFAGVAVMVMAWSECDERVLTALTAGAAGALTKDAEPAELIRAMHLLARGKAVISADTMRGLLHDPPLQSLLRGSFGERLAELTDREREIVALVAGGLTNREIAEQLVISPATAKTHVSRAMMKLHARHRAQLVVLAYESGLVHPYTAARRPTSA